MTIGRVDISSEEKTSYHAPFPIQSPVTQQPTATNNLPQNTPIPLSSGYCGRGRRCYFGKGGRQEYNSRSGQSHTEHFGEFDAYCMDVAPVNISKNQVVPVELHKF